LSEKKEPHSGVLAGFAGPDGINTRNKKAGCKGLYEPTGEVQTCRILDNRAIIGRILHTNRNRGFSGFFPGAGKNPGENISPYRTYFTRSQHMEYCGGQPPISSGKSRENF
jgi:hypothetical protein